MRGAPGGLLLGGDEEAILAEAVFLGDGDPDLLEAGWDASLGLRLALLIGLGVGLLAAGELTRTFRLDRALGARVPPRAAVAAGLEDRDPTRVERALSALARLPPASVAAVIESAPLGRGLPLDERLRPFLEARGDPAARRALVRLATHPRGR